MNCKLIKKFACGVAAAVFCTCVFAKESATVVSASGKFEVQRNQKWVPLKAGDSIQEGELLNTGFKSEAVIRYSGAVMKMGPMTRITLEKLSASDKKDTVSVYLKSGSLRSTVSHADKKIQQSTRSATAVASVRGTDYIETAYGDITVFDGSVGVIPASMFDAAAFGIENPADGSAGATKEQAEKADANVPADGKSTPNTAAADINPGMKGAKVVGAGYSIDFSSGADKFGGRPKSSTTENADKFNAAFTGGSSSESIETAGEGIVAVTGISSQSSSTKGSLILKINVK